MDRNLLLYFQERLARLRDLTTMFEYGADRLAEERKSRVEQNPPEVPCDENGPLFDAAEVAEIQRDRIIETLEQIGLAHELHHRLIRLGVHHVVEQFMRSVAVECHDRFGCPAPGPDQFNPTTWFRQAGIDVTQLDGIAVLKTLRETAGMWKHTGTTTEFDQSWFLRPGYTAGIFLELGDASHEEPEIEEVVDAALRFGRALFNEVESRSP